METFKQARRLLVTFFMRSVIQDPMPVGINSSAVAWPESAPQFSVEAHANRKDLSKFINKTQLRNTVFE